MKVLEVSSGREVAEVMTNHGMTLDEVLTLIGAETDPETGTVTYNGESYDWEDLDIIA